MASQKSKPAKNSAATTTKSTANKPLKKAKLLSSTLAYQGNIFSVYTDHVIEPGGVDGYRDIVRHNGSVVVLAVDDSKSKKDPLICIIRQYRHAAGQFLWELPAGKKDKGEQSLAAAKREMIEETGYRAKKWRKLVRFYPTPGFVGEYMDIFVATQLTAGEAHPEEDEKIEVCMKRLSEVKRQILQGKIHDGKTIIGVMMLAAQI